MDNIPQNSQGGAEIGSPEFARQWEREAGMITRGVERYQKALEEAIADGREDQMFVGVRFLFDIMSCLEPAVEKLQDYAIGKLVTTKRIENWAPLVCIDKTRMAYLAVRCVFAHRHYVDPYDENEDSTLRPVLNVALEVGTQIVRERKFDVWAKRERSQPLRNVSKEVEARVKENGGRIRVRALSERKRKIKKAVKELGAEGAFVDLKPGDGPVRAAVRLLQVLVASCPVYFKRPESNKSFVLVGGQNNAHRQQHVVLTEYAQRMLEHQHQDMARPFLLPMLSPCHEALQIRPPMGASN